MTNEWLAWAWVIGVDLAVIVAAVFATYDRTRLASLAVQHVVAATIVAVLGWEGAANVVASIIASTAFTAPDIGFLAAQAIYAAAAAVMIVFVLRRRRWAVVLGIGLASVRFVLAMLGLADIIPFAESIDPAAFAGTVTFLMLGALPALVAVWLFFDPFLRGQLSWGPSADPEPSSDAAAVDPAPEATPDA
jgi:hypothetical protein